MLYSVSCASITAGISSATEADGAGALLPFCDSTLSEARFKTEDNDRNDESEYPNADVLSKTERNDKDSNHDQCCFCRASRNLAEGLVSGS